MNGARLRELVEIVARRNLNMTETIEVTLALSIFSRILDHPGPNAKEVLALEAKIIELEKAL